MNVLSTLVNVTSPDRRWLYEWYRDVLKLPRREGRGELALVAAGTTLIFGNHHETSGRAKEPQRHVLDLFVTDVEAETQRLEREEVECVERLKRERWGGIVSTFVDPDGNHVRLIEHRAAPG